MAIKCVFFLFNVTFLLYCSVCVFQQLPYKVVVEVAVVYIIELPHCLQEPGRSSFSYKRVHIYNVLLYLSICIYLAGGGFIGSQRQGMQQILVHYNNRSSTYPVNVVFV